MGKPSHKPTVFGKVAFSGGLRIGITVALHTAAGSIAIGDGRRVSSTPRSVVPGNGPEVSLLGTAAARVEHRRYRLIDRDLARGQNELAQPEIERLELGGRIAHPER